MSIHYVPKMYGLFKMQFLEFTNEIQDLIFQEISERLTHYPTYEKPPVRSKMLSGPLECFRRIHITDEIVLIYIVCEECKSYIRNEGEGICKNKLGCYLCAQEPWYTIKLISVGLWGDIYQKTTDMWMSWIHKANAALSDFDKN